MAVKFALQHRSISDSQVAFQALDDTMLDFAPGYNVAPQNEHSAMSNLNEAYARLGSGKARYRIVLDANV